MRGPAIEAQSETALSPSTQWNSTRSLAVQSAVEAGPRAGGPAPAQAMTNPAAAKTRLLERTQGEGEVGTTLCGPRHPGVDHLCDAVDVDIGPTHVGQLGQAVKSPEADRR